MKNNFYYIPVVNRIVFCHDENHTVLILGGLCAPLLDSWTNMFRQEISKKDFATYEPKLIESGDISQYPFLERYNQQDFCGNNFVIVKGEIKNDIDYLDKAKELPRAGYFTLTPIEYCNLIKNKPELQKFL